jgi:hypothetical protein
MGQASVWGRDKIETRSGTGNMMSWSFRSMARGQVAGHSGIRANTGRTTVVVVVESRGRFGRDQSDHATRGRDGKGTANCGIMMGLVALRQPWISEPTC